MSNIPSGWYLCNGSNGTPDLRNKFVIGAHSDSGGEAKTTVTGSVSISGGSKDAYVVSHSHTVNSHTHSFSGSGSSSHSHNIFSTDINDHNDSARRIQNGRNDRTSSVSYTHLTLPTKA